MIVNKTLRSLPIRALILAILGISLSFGNKSYAEDFLSTASPERLFNLGIRLGVNSSIQTFNKSFFEQWNVNSWGSGIDAGVVLDLNMRDYFTVQPGFFFQTRSGSYAYAQDYWDLFGEAKKFTEMGRTKSYNFIVPIMFSFRFNLSPNLRWIAEAGPYAQYKFHSNDNNKIQVINHQSSAATQFDYSLAKSNNFDLGLKIGSGISFKRRYSFYIHYLAGGKHVWKSPHEGGLNKCWSFTAGYDL